MKFAPAHTPESNGMAEAFARLFKRDSVYANELWTTDSVLRRLPEWFADYNCNHYHSGLKYKSSLEYREQHNRCPICPLIGGHSNHLHEHFWTHPCNKCRRQLTDRLV